MKEENNVTTFSCSKDLLKQNSKNKFIIISSMITPHIVSELPCAKPYTSCSRRIPTGATSLSNLPEE